MPLSNTTTRDDFSGRYTTEFPLSDFIEAIESLGLASTQDIAEEVGCSYDLAYRRLKELREKGEIEGRKIGNTYHWIPTSE
ncbi:hth domain-containing protein [Halobiforma nitratireducens JCM 10879]|uniref:Hth domain-containing protein n=1 Tax=Halobiforma nitratireducens JCM 10879 TaxID=1227454 RepID=M0LUB9_9EURY|nr:hth domain-containing protein [Halobiforma nitratireducens JCM 10879]